MHEVEHQIELQDVTVSFPLFDKASRSLKSIVSFGENKAQPRRFVALDNISVNIAPGDRVGLLGNNGAGKSTFLQTVAGIFVPYSGHIKIHGDITSMFQVGTGSDLELSGRDNVPLLMAAQGIPLSMVDELTKDVEDFASLGAAFDRPMRTYSSGMRLRVAFAVATSIQSDILLMDEVVGVGDRWFRIRSKKRIEGMMQGAGTLVLASHSNAYLRAYCNRGLVFDNGTIVFDGDIEDAIRFHSEN